MCAACAPGWFGSAIALNTSACSGPCSAGRYGGSSGLTAAECSGPCTAGYDLCDVLCTFAYARLRQHIHMQEGMVAYARSHVNKNVRTQPLPLRSLYNRLYANDENGNSLTKTTMSPLQLHPTGLPARQAPPRPRPCSAQGAGTALRARVSAPTVHQGSTALLSPDPAPAPPTALKGPTAPAAPRAPCPATRGAMVPPLPWRPLHARTCVRQAPIV